MPDIFNPAAQASQTQARSTPVSKPAQPQSSDLGMRFEKMLWAEMLSHSGLEEAFTKSGGQAASAFSQYMVEAIAEDIARRHPLGLEPTGDAAAPAPQGTANGKGE